MSAFTDSSTHLGLPYIQPAQAQKHVTHNEGVRRLDALVHLAVLSATVTSPPASIEGARYLVPAAATGLWSGQPEGTLAIYEGGAWVFLMPHAGWLTFVQDTGTQLVFDGATWGAAGGGDMQNLDQVGVQTTADAVNRLAVASDAVLLTHAGAGHQVKVNKAALTDTASLLFQTGFSGRAEMGTTGTDDFGIKVSADGTTFTTALRTEAATGRVHLPGNDVRFDGPYCIGDRRPNITVSATWNLANTSGGNLQRLVDGTMGQHVWSNGTDQSGRHIQFDLVEPQQISEFRLQFSANHTTTIKTVIRAANDPTGPWLTLSAPVSWADMMSGGVVTLPATPLQPFAHYRIHAVSGIETNPPWFNGIEMATQG
ncbi:DUF2793 domain-containing protein [Roseovarius sp. LXJ103]|uniref:DUF2793 domain-containing protein n=1 Tax=Roseovarius carneus TaxID=2853164 RepID=UPI000D60357E|nr:DUF2793 domain-containing protein [Roseovarius carneus]MBZ8117589.1 DUF2793 domain-containing protein [Roseovarius carneus]PWE36620.1 ribonuclease III [Pelagicola sp. LXJ1103]